MALAGRNRRPITAAAQKIGFSQVVAEKLRDQPWQERAWDVYDKLGPIYYMTRYRSAVARKVDYFAARKDSPGTDPDNDVVLDDEGEIAQLGPATKVLEAEGGPELIRRIVSELMVHWDVAGEAYLVRFEESPFWRVLSTQELKSKKGNYLWDQAPAGMGEIDGDNVYRVWKPHPRQHWQADSPTRHVLEDAEGLILSGREIRARSLSRLSAGILLLPDTLDLSPFADDTEGSEDDVARWLTSILAGPVKDPGSTQGISPSVMTMSGDDIAKVRHMTFDREWDVSIELREEQLNHVALGIDMPPELATGTAGSMNHWGSWWLTDEAVNMHVLPTVDDILDSLSVNWFRPLLEAASVDPQGYVIWRDPSAATVPTDRSDVALKMFELGAISGTALRRVTDFDEEDAPGEDDVVPGESAEPEGVGQNGPPPPPVQGSFDALVAAVLERLKEGGPPLASAAVTAATRRRIAATELADIDADILAWTVAEADREIDRLLLKIGITSATDPLDESLLAGFARRVEAQIAKAQAAAKSWVERLTGRAIPDEQLSLFRQQGVQIILAGVLEAVRRRLFTPQGGADPIDTGRIADILPPTSAIREGLSLAGGGPAVYEDGHTSELIGNGQFIQDELRQDGYVPELMVWRTGAPSDPFDPHQRLSGVEFDSWDSPKLSITLDGQWISGTHYRPGDHKGCQCSVEMVLVALSESRSQSGIRLDEPTPEGPPLTWEHFGVKLPTDPARRELMQQALLRLNGLEPGVRQRFIQLLEKFEGRVKINVATASTKSIRELGRVAVPTLRGRIQDEGFKLSLHLSRQTDEWDEWVTRHNAFHRELTRDPAIRLPSGGLNEQYRSRLDEWTLANPEPPQWRLATPDELADVLIHELGHANDYQHFFDTGKRLTGRLPDDLRTKVWEMYWGGPRGSKTARNGAYEYATSESVEMVAELQKFYLRGVHSHGLDLTAGEWRLAHPELARWVEENLLL